MESTTETFRRPAPVTPIRSLEAEENEARRRVLAAILLMHLGEEIRIPLVVLDNVAKVSIRSETRGREMVLWAETGPEAVA